MESHFDNLDDIKIWLLTLLQQELPGKVRIKRAQDITIHCLVPELPEKFIAYKGDVSSTDFVKFRWKNPGQCANDNIPEAIEVYPVDENEINALKDDIQKLLVPGIRRRLKKKLGEIRLIEEEAIQRAEELANSAKKDKEEADRLWAAIEPYHHAVPLLNQDKSPTTNNQFGHKWNQMLDSSGLLLPPCIKTSYLLALVSAFYSGSLILLNGSVGVGKTSLVEYSATLLGGKHSVIPVRPAWLDSSDLLGFFDPLSVTFRPTPFITALKDANKHPDRIHLVCLDELNLAKIENYGADLLSCLEYSRQKSLIDNKRGLLLYSESISEDLKSEFSELNILKKELQLDFKQTLRFKTLKTILDDYPANFYIPQNLVLIGTLNADETTYDLSPKVIDRSFVITYPPADLGNDGISNPIAPESIKEEISVVFLKNKIAELYGENREGWKRVVEWNDYLSKHKLGIPLGYRAKREYQVFSAAAHYLGIEEEECLGHFLFTKVLPRISFSKGSDSDNYNREELCEKWFGEIEIYQKFGATEVINQMQEQLNDDRRRNVRYWG
ncbi:AAA family ATPase [Trichocoleus sp. FACHB-832]|uniref:AAA family ATPase n=1 Tax=Trichocoleus sp. FACHB-832 TaxID=2692875 RepID=UPI0016896B11|nr:AAA family ATPase [Trichocoleus sp. FACHB-832]MBD1906450.1 AAA family ATPase [Trichocoleus sp. FACHB-832]